MKQQTPEWFAARLGKVTASRISDVMAQTKSGYGAARKNYMAELLVERMTGLPTESYVNAAMQRGIDEEPIARSEYEAATGEMVTEVGFIDHPLIADSGASPDGLVGLDGLVEIKCPNTATHIETLLTKTVERKYRLQMQWQLDCTDRGWCDYVSYDGRMPDKLKLCIIRIQRDQSLIDDIRGEVVGFLAELDTMIKNVNKLREV